MAMFPNQVVRTSNQTGLRSQPLLLALSTSTSVMLEAGTRASGDGGAAAQTYVGPDPGAVQAEPHYLPQPHAADATRQRHWWHLHRRRAHPHRLGHSAARARGNRLRLSNVHQDRRAVSSRDGGGPDDCVAQAIGQTLRLSARHWDTLTPPTPRSSRLTIITDDGRAKCTLGQTAGNKMIARCDMSLVAFRDRTTPNNFI